MTDLLASIPKDRLSREARHYLYRNNFEVFARDQLKIRTKEGGEVRPLYPLRASQQRYLASTLKQLDEEGFARQIWFKSRQPGGTTLASALVNQKCVLNKNTNALIIAHDKPTAREIFVMHQTFHQHLHPSIRPMVKHDTTEGMVFDNPDSKELGAGLGLNSRIFIATAKNVHSGVGRTLHAAHLSEVARYENPEELQSAIFDAVPMKYRSLLIMESAASYNPASSWFKAMCDTVRKEKQYSPWRFTFVGAQFDPDCALPLHDGEILDYTKEEQTLLLQDGVTPEFLKWRRYKVAEFAENGGTDRFQQSYPVTYEEAWIIPGTNLLTGQTLRDLKAQVRDPIFTGVIHDFNHAQGGWFSLEAEGPLKVWEWPQPGEAYDIAWDVCLPDGEWVNTEHGPAEIQAVLPTERLYDADGMLTPIVKIFKREYCGPLFSIQPHGASRPTRFTPEHPICVLEEVPDQKKRISNKDRRLIKPTKRTWKQARNICKGDVLCVPILYRSVLSEDEILSHFPDDEHVRIDRRISDRVLLNKEFWFLMGLWLAEGYAHVSRNNQSQFCNIYFSLNAIKEQELATRVVSSVKHLFSRTASNRTKNSSVAELHFTSETIYQFIEDNFGHGAKNKYIANWIKCLPSELKLSLVKGYVEGDGHIRELNDPRRLSLLPNGQQVNIVSVSERLLNDIQDILLSVGVYAPVKTLRGVGYHAFPNGRTCPTLKTFEMNLSRFNTQKLFRLWGDDRVVPSTPPWSTHCWMDETTLYVKVRTVKEEGYDGQVNNFETGTNTYSGRLIAVHNCAGVGQTYTVGTVLKRRDKSEVAEWRDNTINPGSPLVNVAKWLGLAYNTAQVAIESNPGNPGYYTNSELGKVYPNMFIWKNYSKVASKILTKDTGWDTTPNSKVFLISTMLDWLSAGKTTIRSETLWKELTTFRKYSDRLYEAIPGEMDDCVLPGQLVNTPSAHTPIEDICVGSTVLSHVGFSRRVTKTLRKQWSGEIVEILPVGQQPPMVVTSDHPVWSALKRKTPLYQRDGGRVVTPLTHVPFAGAWRTAGTLQKGEYVFLPKRRDLSPSVYSDDVLWMMGWYLAEGCVSTRFPHLISFSLHKKERAIGERILAILKAHDQDTAPWKVNGFTDKNGRAVRGFVRPNAKHQADIVPHSSCENAITVKYSSLYWAELLSRECGRVATGRSLSPGLFASNNLMPLVVGFFDGDGSQTHSAGHHHLVVGGIAHELISQIRQILLDNGIWSTQHIAPARNGGQSQSLLHVTKAYFEKFVGSSKVHVVPSRNRHRIVHETETGFWVPIKRVVRSPYKGPVYNLEVETDNSFVVQGMAVHNCVMSYAICLRASIDETFEGWDGPPVEVKAEQPIQDQSSYDRNWGEVLRKNSYRDGFERAAAEQEAWE